MFRICEGGRWGAFGIQSEFVDVYSTSADEVPERVIHPISSESAHLLILVFESFLTHSLLATNGESNKKSRPMLAILAV